MTKPKCPQAIEQVDTAKLIPYAKNSRTHTESQVAQIAASIREFGFTNPVLIDAENGIIAGHGRVMAAQLLKMDKVPCIRLGYLTETQRKAYVIADNRLAEKGAEWDMDILKNELETLLSEGFDLALTGFDLNEITEDEPEIKTLSIERPPRLAWILISVPIEKFGKVQALMDDLPNEAETYTTYTDED